MNEQDKFLNVKNSAGYKTEITSGDNSILADEPVESGGTDLGLNPYDLLLSALGSCKAMTMRMYAERKQYPLKEIIINLSHGKVHAEDCKDCETKEGKIDHINVEIMMTGDLTAEQKMRLLDISKKCPVHRTLTSEVKIITTEAK